MLWAGCAVCATFVSVWRQQVTKARSLDCEQPASLLAKLKMHVSASLSAAFKLLSNPSHRKLQVQCLLLSIIHSIPYIHTTTTKSTHQNQIMFFRSLPALRHRTAQENAHWGHSQQQYSTATASARARSQYRRGGQAVAAVADDDTKSPPAQPTHTTDPGLEAFKALIAERRFMCTQCGKCCTGATLGLLGCP